jgi:quercetin dioxygenase-like cupin family protein
MKQMKQWVLAVTLICGATAFMTGCKKATVQEANVQETVAQEDSVAAQTVTSEELIRTSQSWDGVELPDYFKGRPELVAMKYVFPAGQKLGWHHHPVMNYGILVQGELTIIGQDGKEKTVHEGEAVVEMVNTIHHGENRGTKPVILYMFYLSQKDLPLAVQHPEIPLE